MNWSCWRILTHTDRAVLGHPVRQCWIWKCKLPRINCVSICWISRPAIWLLRWSKWVSPEFRGESDVNFISPSMSSHCVNDGASFCAGDNERKLQSHPYNFAKLPPRTLLTVTASDRAKSDGHDTTSTPRQNMALKSVNQAGKKAPDQPKIMTSLAEETGNGTGIFRAVGQAFCEAKRAKKAFS